MSKLFNIFPDSSSEEECDFEDGKTQHCVLKGRKMKMNFWLSRTRECWPAWAGSALKSALQLH